MYSCTSLSETTFAPAQQPICGVAAANMTQGPTIRNNQTNIFRRLLFLCCGGGGTDVSPILLISLCKTKHINSNLRSRKSYNSPNAIHPDRQYPSPNVAGRASYPDLASWSYARCWGGRDFLQTLAALWPGDFPHSLRGVKPSTNAMMCLAGRPKSH